MTKLFTKGIVLALLLAAYFSFSHTSAAARPQQEDKQPVAGLAVQIVGPDQAKMKSLVLPPPSEGGWMETGSFKQIRGWQRPEGELPLTRIRLKSNYEGQSVRIKLIGIFDDSEDPSLPGPKYGEREKNIASYLLREGETVEAKELKTFGVEPLILKIVPVKFQLGIPSSEPIEVKVNNPLKTVEVTGVEKQADSPDTYLITIRNLTEKNIIALQLDQPDEDGGGGSSQSAESSFERQLIAPFGTYQEQVQIQPRRSSHHGQNTEENTAPQPISLIVGTVVFEDGSSEGDERRAAQIITQREGRRAQLLRAIQIIRNLSSEADRNDAKIVGKIRAGVASLRIDAEDSLIGETLEKFPILSKGDAAKNLATDLMQGLKNGRSEVLYQIDDFQRQQKINGTRISVSDWLKQLIADYETRLNSASTR